MVMLLTWHREMAEASIIGRFRWRHVAVGDLLELGDVLDYAHTIRHIADIYQQ
jgi:hypothetical protein